MFKVFDSTINSSFSLTCNFVQATNKIMTIVAKSHPSVGKEDPPRKKVIPKDLGQSKRKGKDYEVDDYTEGSMQKGKIILFEGG